MLCETKVGMTLDLSGIIRKDGDQRSPLHKSVILHKLGALL